MNPFFVGIDVSSKSNVVYLMFPSKSILIHFLAEIVICIFVKIILTEHLKIINLRNILKSLAILCVRFLAKTLQLFFTILRNNTIDIGTIFGLSE